MEQVQVLNKQEIATNSSPISADLYKRYIAFIDTPSQKTIDTYASALKQLFMYFKTERIEHPKREDILNFRDELKAKGYKSTTIQSYIVACRLFFKWLDTEGYYPNITEHIKGAKVDRNHKKDYLTSDQVKNILANIDQGTPAGLRNYAIVLLMVTCALRTIEVSRANIGDLKTLGNSRVLYIQGKGKEDKAEYVKIAPQVEQAINAYLKTRDIKSDDAPLFVSSSNNSLDKRLSTRTISKICKQAFINAGYDSDRLTAHSLRHTAITLSILGGEDITQVQKFARHTNIANTMIYNHAIDMINNDCSNLIANTLV